MCYDLERARASFNHEGNVHYGFIEKFIEELGQDYNIKRLLLTAGSGADGADAEVPVSRWFLLGRDLRM